MTWFVCVFITFITTIYSCRSWNFDFEPSDSSNVSPVDPNATSETICLYQELYNTAYSSTGVIFGHHESNFKGQSWEDPKGIKNESDVLTSVGQFPGFYEYNLDKFLTNNVNFTNHILSAVKRGGMVGFHWEATNPVTGGTDKDTSGSPIQNLMPGKSANPTWTSYLDKIAQFIKTLNYDFTQLLKEDNNHVYTDYDNLEYKSNLSPIPFTFRLFHECLGSWYWWGQNYCTSEEYISAYNYTRWYLVSHHELHNLLFVYAPNSPSEYFNNSNDYIIRYPGDDIIDITAFDHYGENDIATELIDDLHLTIQFGMDHNKVTSIAEFGVQNGIQETNDSDWFMNSAFYPIFNDSSNENPKGYSIAYMNTWANFSPQKYWVPLPDQETYDSFVQFFQQSETLFQKDVPDLYHC